MGFFLNSNSIQMRQKMDKCVNLFDGQKNLCGTQSMRYTDFATSIILKACTILGLQKVHHIRSSYS